MVLTYPFNALYIDFNDSDIKWQTYYSNLFKMLDEFHIALIATNINSKDQIDTLNRLGIRLASVDYIQIFQAINYLIRFWR